MNRRFLPLVVCLLIAAAVLPGGAPVPQKVPLSIVTAGDTNMEELQRNVFGPEFVKRNPDFTVRRKPQQILRPGSGTQTSQPVVRGQRPDGYLGSIGLRQEDPLHCIAGFLDPDDGAIYFGGENVS